MNQYKARNWYVLYTKPRNEKKVTGRLQEQGINAYCPLIRTMRQWSDRKKKVQIPMFSGYVFVNVDEKERLLTLQDPGVVNFIFWLGKPAVIRDNEIEAIKKIATSGDEVRVESGSFEKGKAVTIPDGPFKGMAGVVDKLDKRKVIVYVEQLACMVSFKYKIE